VVRCRVLCSLAAGRPCVPHTAQAYLLVDICAMTVLLVIYTGRLTARLAAPTIKARQLQLQNAPRRISTASRGSTVRRRSIGSIRSHVQILEHRTSTMSVTVGSSRRQSVVKALPGSRRASVRLSGRLSIVVVPSAATLSNVTAGSVAIEGTSSQPVTPSLALVGDLVPPDSPAPRHGRDLSALTPRNITLGTPLSPRDTLQSGRRGTNLLLSGARSLLLGDQPGAGNRHVPGLTEMVDTATVGGGGGGGLVLPVLAELDIDRDFDGPSCALGSAQWSADPDAMLDVTVEPVRVGGSPKVSPGRRPNRRVGSTRSSGAKGHKRRSSAAELAAAAGAAPAIAIATPDSVEGTPAPAPAPAEAVRPTASSAQARLQLLLWADVDTDWRRSSRDGSVPGMPIKDKDAVSRRD
jgi:hypothetical protein